MAKTEFTNEVALGDCLELLPRVSDHPIQTVHTSPAYNIARGYEGHHDSLTDKDCCSDEVVQSWVA